MNDQLNTDSDEPSHRVRWLGALLIVVALGALAWLAQDSTVGDDIALPQGPRLLHSLRWWNGWPALSSRARRSQLRPLPTTRPSPWRACPRTRWKSVAWGA